MKFARYLEDHCPLTLAQTPEWKRAYIDYRKLKKCIKAIQKRQVSGLPPPLVQDGEGVGEAGDAERAVHGRNGERIGEGKPPGQGDTAHDHDEEEDDDSDTGPSTFPRQRPDTEPHNKSKWRHSASNTPRLAVPPDTPVSTGYGSMGRTPPMARHRPSSPPILVLPDASNPETETTRVAPSERTSTETKTASASAGEETPFAVRGKDKHAHWNDGADPRGEDEGGPSHAARAEESQESASGRDSSSGDEDRHLPPKAAARATKSPRMLAAGKSPSFLGRSPRLFGGKVSGEGKERPVVGSRVDSFRPSSSAAGMAPRYPETLDQLYSMCYADERRFFTTLDAELEKVESFYHDRESDAIRRSHQLKAQLRELAEHRRVFHEAEEERQRAGGVRRLFGDVVEEVGKHVPFVSPAANGDVDRVEGGGKSGPLGEEGGADGLRQRKSLPSAGKDLDPMMREFNPEKYQRYKKKLKLAVMEYYKELEILKNYRILNLTGFKKALKKFEKTARIRCIDLYMDEKVSKISFADNRPVDALLKEIEDEYTERFEKGDHKKAVDRLRGQFDTSTHHLSTFWSGVYIGIGVPVFILGLVKALEPGMTKDFPQRDGLLQVYGTLFLPVLFGMLFELNLTAYVSARINYPFIMELDVRTALDHRQFLEIPALLFAVLSFCFYFSFHFTGSPGISPYAWPIVWIVFTVLFFINPVPVYYQHARYWLLSVLARVFTPGYSRVEFIAFFVADELNSWVDRELTANASLSYTFGNFWFIGCAYNKGWPANIFSACSASHNWVYGLLLAIPALIRLIQCIKRWYDSRLQIHLINAGKYTSNVAQFASISSIYTSSWDLAVDWGLLRPRHAYLRESLGYPTIKPYYYVAMVTNVLIRFIWVWYIPASASYLRTRSFFFALAEMLRRWQWNFFRVETEQVGNTDQYRVTREVPLPYHRLRDDEDLDEELERISSKYGKEKGFSLRRAAFKLEGLRAQLIKRNKKPPSTGPDAINAGPTGDEVHRDYEPRRLPSFGAMSSSVGSNGGEGEVVSDSP
ncbi:hypothetical protein QFC20_000578 [Naganishia adeliensis]|uniref:Uncharacterized protein n=1 Tax=Naganishia adeliensis TaxID=92952 RepID=A0ACC2WZ93_9TREE|nr:hypothetical protein QFC20_000578 [Naganishia adeliensis]